MKLKRKNKLSSNDFEDIITILSKDNLLLIQMPIFKKWNVYNSFNCTDLEGHSATGHQTHV